jgi:hypothetical protein
VSAENVLANITDHLAEIYVKMRDKWNQLSQRKKDLTAIVLERRVQENVGFLEGQRDEGPVKDDPFKDDLSAFSAWGKYLPSDVEIDSAASPGESSSAWGLPPRGPAQPATAVYLAPKTHQDIDPANMCEGYLINGVFQ